MPIVYILTLLLVTAVVPQCTPTLYSRNITTGISSLLLEIITFSAANIQYGAYTFTFTNPFTTLPQTALSIIQITTTSPSALNNSYFYLTSSPTTQGVTIILAAVTSNWLVSRVCLWASTNTELLLGSAPTCTCVLMQQIQNQRPVAQPPSSFKSRSVVPYLLTTARSPEGSSMVFTVGERWVQSRSPVFSILRAR